jgi:hypothetical protein
VTFASSIHWVDAKLLFSKLRRHLKPDHLRAIINSDMAFAPPWETGLQDVPTKWVSIASGCPLESKK